jgi:2-methylisocitrate lyase-like PEP mutase family enzyme
MATKGAPSIGELTEIGVRRVSLGAWPMSAAMRGVGAAAAAVAKTGDYSALDNLGA